jgi:hypothetical protein
VKKLMIISALAISSAAHANDTIERFSIARTGDGYVRTDTATGAVSKCTETAGQLVCRMAADDRQAYDANISDLQMKIDSLEKRISALEKSAPLGSVLQTPAQDEKEFETSLNQMEQFFRRFMGIVKEFQQFGSDTAPTPGRT